MSDSITVQLTPEAMHRFRWGAGVAGKPLEEFLLDRLLDAVPPRPKNISSALREELDALERLDETELREVAASQLPPTRQRLYSDLLVKNAAGTATVEERQQLRVLGDEARELTLKKAHAYLLLKWRGSTIPSVRELEDIE